MTSTGEMIVSEMGNHRVSLIDKHGQKIQTFGEFGKSPSQMIYPAGVTIDKEGFIYVSSWHKLQKFTGARKEMMKCVGEKGSEKGKFNDPRGLAIYKNQLYVCDRKNHRIQIFNSNLEHVKCIGSHGQGKGEFDEPYDVAFDSSGNMYVAEFNNKRVQVLDTATGKFVRMIGEGQVGMPTGLHVAGNKLFVSNLKDDHVAVCDIETLEHSIIASRGTSVGELRFPFGITSFEDKVLVCDSANDRIQSFVM